MGAFTFTEEGAQLHAESARCSRKARDWKEELASAAKLTAKKAKKPLWLAMSGGMDSEVMGRVFFDQGLQFSVLTLEHTEGTNTADVERAKNWCWTRGVPHKIERISIRKLLTEDIDAYAKEGLATDAIARYLQLKVLEIADGLGGFAVLGGGALIPRVSEDVDEPQEKDVYLQFNVGHTIIPRWCTQHKAAHEPYFFSSTPEVCLSYFSVPAVALGIENPEMFKSTAGAFIIKLMAYQTCWPDIQPRYTDFGFRHLVNDARAARVRMQTAYPKTLKTFRLPYPELRAQLAPAK